MKYLDLSFMLDMAHVDVLAEFPRCAAFIRSALQERVACLVHCVYGQSRSAAVVTAYVMHALRCDADSAFQFVYGTFCVFSNTLRLSAPCCPLLTAAGSHIFVCRRVVFAHAFSGVPRGLVWQ